MLSWFKSPFKLEGGRLKCWIWI